MITKNELYLYGKFNTERDLEKKQLFNFGEYDSYRGDFWLIEILISNIILIEKNLVSDDLKETFLSEINTEVEKYSIPLLNKIAKEKMK